MLYFYVYIPFRIQQSREPYDINNIFGETHEIGKIGQKNSSILHQLDDHVKLINTRNSIGAGKCNHLYGSMDSK